jgi:PAS domain-containing protein
MSRKPEDIAKQLDIVEKRLMLAKQASGCGIWDWHVTDDVLIWDEEMYRMFQPKERTGNLNMFLSCLHPDDVKVVSEKLDTALGGTPYDYRYRVITPKGTFHIRGKGAVVERLPDGTASRLTGVCFYAEESPCQ